MLTCHLPGCDGKRYPGTTLTDWDRHEAAFHAATPVPQLPAVDWHTRALAAVRDLAGSGRPFTFYEVAKIAGDPVNPRTEWGTFAKQVRHLGIAVPVGYQESERPETRGSAVKVWRAPVKQAAA